MFERISITKINMVQMILGCGKEVSHGMVCGDSIDTGDYNYITGHEYCQPILCDECWIIQNKLKDKKECLK